MDMFSTCEEYTAVHSFHIMIMEKVEEAGEIYGRTVLHFYLWSLRMSAG